MIDEDRIQQRKTLARQLMPAILAEAQAEEIPLTSGGAYRLAWAAVGALEDTNAQNQLH